MLLLPLLENAVKYSPPAGGKVVGLVDIKAGRLHFTLSNKTGEIIARPAAETEDAGGGIGLTNIRRRLDLLFPGDHAFSTQEENGHYTVNLEIPLTG